MKYTETVLLYNPKNSEKARKMKVVLLRMGVRIKNVTEDMLQQSVGTILGIEGFENIASPEAKGETEEEVLVMFGFTNGRIDTMLREFKKARIPRVNLKAIVTDHNVRWTFAALIDELQKEHEAMTKYETAEHDVEKYFE